MSPEESISLTNSKELQREERAAKKQKSNSGQHSVFKKRHNELAAARKRKEGQ